MASLPDYTAGTLHGDWFDLDDFTDTEDLHAAIQERVLSNSPIAVLGGGPVEEFTIHDDEDFAGIKLDENTPLATVFALHQALERASSHRDATTDAFAAWVEHHGVQKCAKDWNNAAKEFEESYVGQMSLREYVIDHYTDLFAQPEFKNLPEAIRNSIDYSNVATYWEDDFTEMDAYLFRATV
ncbi:antirestriction protein ArdA (plasmid) [Nocardia sp. NBC_01377]|uniref:antirestriction protein ArdA n=1 Tax=Nocardia sp. NBC_01377 TaxID=2903595 RepID=UPI0032456217